MTTPTAPDKKMVKDVASEIERRRRRRRLIMLLVWLALIIAAALYLRCGRGWGLGGGKGTGTGSGSAAIAQPAVGPTRCTVRVSAEGISVDGTKKSRDEAVEACKKTEGAMVTVTGDAREGDWDELRAGLQAVGVKIYIRGELWDGKTDPTVPAPKQP